MFCLKSANVLIKLKTQYSTLWFSSYSDRKISSLWRWVLVKDAFVPCERIRTSISSTGNVHLISICCRGVLGTITKKCDKLSKIYKNNFNVDPVLGFIIWLCMLSPAWTEATFEDFAIQGDLRTDEKNLGMRLLQLFQPRSTILDGSSSQQKDNVIGYNWSRCNVIRLKSTSPNV